MDNSYQFILICTVLSFKLTFVGSIYGRIMYFIIFYLVIQFLSWGSHTDSCNLYHFLLMIFTCHRPGSSNMVTVSDSCPIHTILSYYLFIMVLIYYGFDLSLIIIVSGSCLILSYILIEQWVNS